MHPKRRRDGEGASDILITREDFDFLSCKSFSSCRLQMLIRGGLIKGFRVLRSWAANVGFRFGKALSLSTRSFRCSNQKFKRKALTAVMNWSLCPIRSERRAEKEPVFQQITCSPKCRVTYDAVGDLEIPPFPLQIPLQSTLIEITSPYITKIDRGSWRFWLLFNLKCNTPY